MNKRVIYFDLLRIIACFLVIVNHTVKDAFIGYPLDTSGMICCGYLMLSKIAVPLFLMLSGALLLNKDYNLKDIWVNKILRTCIAIALFSIYVFVFIEKRPIQPLGWLSSMIQEPAFVAYWYVYALLGIYLMLPFLRILVKNMEQIHFHYLFALSFLIYGILSFLVDLKVFPPYSTIVTGQLISSEITYMFLGYYLTHFQLKIKNSTLWIIFISTLAFATLFTIGEYLRYNQFQMLLDRHFVFTSILMSSTLFVLFQRYEPLFKNRLANCKSILVLSESTFGIYMIHGIVMYYLADFQQMMYSSMNRLIALIFNEISIFMICFILVRLLLLLPTGRYILNAPKKN